MGKKWKLSQTFFSWAPKSLEPWNKKMLAPRKKSCDKPRQCIQKQRHHFADKGHIIKTTFFSGSHVWMWELDHEEGCIVQSFSRVHLFLTPWIAAHQPSLSFAISWSLLKLMSIEPVMPSNHLILCHPLLLLPSIFPSIRVFSNESALHIRWPKY